MSDMKDNSNGSNHSAIHLSLQGKGGVGKTLISSMLAQYFLKRGDRVQCIDTDPLNHTLAQYKGLPVQPLRLLRGSRINERKFDSLVDQVLSENGIFVVDNGASTFLPLWNYILENNVLRLLSDAGKRL